MSRVRVGVRVELHQHGGVVAGARRLCASHRARQLHQRDVVRQRDVVVGLVRVRVRVRVVVGLVHDNRPHLVPVDLECARGSRPPCRRECAWTLESAQAYIMHAWCLCISETEMAWAHAWFAAAERLRWWWCTLVRARVRLGLGLGGASG